MPVLHTPPTSPSDPMDSGNEYQPLTLSLADIAATIWAAIGDCYLGDPSRIISGYDTAWWIRCTAIPDELWQWDWVMGCCIFHYQHWLGGVEDNGLILPEQVDNTSMGLKWLREHLQTLVEEQEEGISEKMAEIEVYTGILTRLKRGRGE
ncbi:uncharacterized protein BJ212DRAFT_1299118 [Suillus subaureus]|uniref:Uncharacterized protein n=1 Tax=Suillus subaureus TaxID=48587 RepID=A0A9P7EC42_9AGAM|nr:uncharacterized protein BJ212DRAFT_1299118 [Suillus subaureus]KAG1817576.1 hypothetical protein BJ212DRAFT_1299118 [Suillus subaureus]